MNKPEVKRLQSVVFNGIITVESKSDDTNGFNKLDVSTLNGDLVNDLFIGAKLCDKVKSYVGKIIDITYKDCIAGITEYTKEDDISETIFTHSVNHKQIVDIAVTSDINLLIACSKAGLKEVFNELKEINHA